MSEIGRPVRVVSISFGVGKTLEEVAVVVDQEGALGVDLIALPETWLGQGEGTEEPIDGPMITTMSELAQKHSAYIVCPIDRIDDGRRLNSAVLLDRNGDVSAIYDKLYPYWGEFGLVPVIDVGQNPVVAETDFGRVGFAICFDVNFPDMWQTMADQGAELVVWPSAYSAGRALQAHAIMHHYFIVTATQSGDCQIFDITGERILDERSEGITVSRAVLDFDRGIYHHNFNLDKRDLLLQEHGYQVAQEEFFHREHWFVLKATAPGASARDLARQYGLEELREYKARSQRQMDVFRSDQVLVTTVTE